MLCGAEPDEFRRLFHGWVLANDEGSAGLLERRRDATRRRLGLAGRVLRNQAWPGSETPMPAASEADEILSGGKLNSWRSPFLPPICQTPFLPHVRNGIPPKNRTTTESPQHPFFPGLVLFTSSSAIVRPTRWRSLNTSHTLLTPPSLHPPPSPPSLHAHDPSPPMPSTTLYPPHPPTPTASTTL